MMERLLSNRRNGPVHATSAHGCGKLRLLTWGAALSALLAGAAAWGQVITIDTNGKGPVAVGGPVSREYQQIEPTKIKLSERPMDPKTKLLLVRFLESEQGFAMRPFPRGHKGMTLEANGELKPAGESYLNMATQNGISAKPGERVVITNVKIDHDKIVLDLNGGPDAKHRFLRHIQIGMGDPTYGDPTQPVVQSGPDPTGARLTLTFHGGVPELTGDEVESLLAPLISFKVQTPIEAYTATLPPPLKKAIMNHEVWVGMNTDMVTFAKGRPEKKYRETEDNMPVTIWMYGQAPKTVTFVRFNGNRVIKVEIAKVGQPIEVFTKDEVTPLLMASGTKLEAQNVHHVQEGDVQRDPNTQAPAPPPTLGAPGEKLPQTNPTARGQEGPVYFPPDDSSNDPPVAHRGSQPNAQPSTPSKTQPSAHRGSQPDAQPSTPLGQNPDAQPPANHGSQPQPAGGDQKQTAPTGSQQRTPSGQTGEFSPGSAGAN